jgi:hypothetical protein
MVTPDAATVQARSEVAGAPAKYPVAKGKEVMKTADRQHAYILFGTSACHLCELAQEMLEAQCESRPGFAFEKVDIIESDALVARYGVRIPVLRDPEGRELGWPFTSAELREFTDP